MSITDNIIPLLTADADDVLLAKLNTPTITPRPFYANARTLYSLSPALAKTILDTVKMMDANLYDILMQVGTNDGSAGGVDLSLQATTDFMARLVAGGVIQQAQADAILALGKNITYACGRAITADELAAARAQDAANKANQARIDALEVLIGWARSMFDWMNAQATASKMDSNRTPPTWADFVTRAQETR